MSEASATDLAARLRELDGELITVAPWARGTIREAARELMAANGEILRTRFEKAEEKARADRAEALASRYKAALESIAKSTCACMEAPSVARNALAEVPDEKEEG